MELPSLEEGFEELFYVQSIADGGFIVERRRIQRHSVLSIEDAYSQFVRNVIAEQNNNPPRPSQLEQ